MADLAAANAYFVTRLHAAAWTSATDSDKTAALITAETQLRAIPRINPNADPAGFQKAVYEQALFLLRVSATEQRLDLQAQGVAAAGIQGGASESYRATAAGEGFPLAPMARTLLARCFARTAVVR